MYRKQQKYQSNPFSPLAKPKPPTPKILRPRAPEVELCVCGLHEMCFSLSHEVIPERIFKRQAAELPALRKWGFHAVQAQQELHWDIGADYLHLRSISGLHIGIPYLGPTLGSDPKSRRIGTHQEQVNSSMKQVPSSESTPTSPQPWQTDRASNCRRHATRSLRNPSHVQRVLTQRVHIHYPRGSKYFNHECLAQTIL